MTWVRPRGGCASTGPGFQHVSPPLPFRETRFFLVSGHRGGAGTGTLPSQDPASPPFPATLGPRLFALYHLGSWGKQPFETPRRSLISNWCQPVPGRWPCPGASTPPPPACCSHKGLLCCSLAYPSPTVAVQVTGPQPSPVLPHCPWLRRGAIHGSPPQSQWLLEWEEEEEEVSELTRQGCGVLGQLTQVGLHRPWPPTASPPPPVGKWPFSGGSDPHRLAVMNAPWKPPTGILSQRQDPGCGSPELLSDE